MILWTAKLQGRVEGDRVFEETLASKKKKSSKDAPKASKKKASKSTSDNRKSLDEKWSQRFARLESMILAKSFALPMELVQKSSSAVVTSEKPFFVPEKNGAGTSQKITGLVTQPSVLSDTSTCPVQTTGHAASFTATQPVEAPGARMKTATQPVEAPSAKVATQPVEALGTRPVFHPKATDASIEEVQAT